MGPHVALLDSTCDGPSGQGVKKMNLPQKCKVTALDLHLKAKLNPWNLSSPLKYGCKLITTKQAIRVLLPDPAGE